ncbi:SigE family RNA polymerase sigma factor [Kribbella sandramycini]|uniref:RNA polymerase sigma-70 factor (Sigma-E family) n=1 Tax=Kribbella sandramycini TaxID=60450 RepID=A0A7Y4KZL5_9ACTN|nr:SigE family RNA polymerase sigma factor [Kribbella sandramycini]MBB6569575.1 RNA polymerase sigma-70 factor (sigma-E family) [Kribbella sandramycini]NOL40591.1 SigE family RNA polymerase sigma factor [Kribbella sandramycini]
MREEFAEFARGRHGALYRYAYLLAGERGLADDLVQEGLVKTYVAWKRLRDPSAAEAYTRRVITNTAISWYRRKSWHERPHDELPEQFAPVQDSTARMWLWQELMQLPPRQRAAVVLRFYEDLTEPQTAEVLGCSVGTVKSQVSVALRKLRDRLGADAIPLDKAGASQ